MEEVWTPRLLEQNVLLLLFVLILRVIWQDMVLNVRKRNPQMQKKFDIYDSCAIIVLFEYRE